MLLQPVTIGAELVFLTREEAARIEVIQHTISVHGRHKAREDWLAWVKDVAKIPTQRRRLAAGRALDFHDKAEFVETEASRRLITNACGLHAFDTHGVDIWSATVPDRLLCVMCKETLPTLEAIQYARGFAASGNDPNTIIEGFGR